MAVAINNFVQAMTGGGQVRTQNMFELTISTGYTDIDNIMSKVTIYGQGFTLPSRTLNTVEVSFKGHAFPIPSNTAMEHEHTMTVNADVAGEIRRAFLAWQAKTWNPDFDGGSVLEGDRRANTGSVLRVHLFSHDMREIAETYKLVGVRVTDVGGLQVSQTGGEVAQFEVKFTSLYWKIETDSIKEGAFSDQV